jgi:DNA-binding transcriptional ArsR family regulator
MSYQGTEWARRISGNRGEKNVLAQLGHRLDQRTNIAHVSEFDLARDTGLSERQVRRILRQLEERGIVKQTGGRGRGNFARYSFVGFQCGKGDILSLEKRSFETGKADIPAAKADIGETAIRKEEASKKPQEETPQRHGFAELDAGCSPQTAKAINVWTGIKKRLKLSLAPCEFSQWIRSTLVLRVMGDCILLAHPPDGRINEKLRACSELQRMVRDAGYGGALFTAYPDDFDLRKLEERFPDAYDSIPPALKKRARSVA